MKKQILFSLLLAIFAGSIAYGQAINGSIPRGILCVDTPLNPIAGKEYTYQAGSNQPGSYTFWATKDVNFISAGTTNMATTKLTTASGDLLTASANYAAADVSDNVKITWSDAILSGTTVAAPTFVAVNQDGSCTNNFKVWAIKPIKAFTVDIRNMENATVAPLAYGANEDQCFDQVRGAKYNAANNGGTVEYDYGTQVLYFEVVAANFTTSWTPTFTLAGLGNGQTALIQWDYNKTFNSGAAGAPYTVASGAVSATPVSTALTSTTSGVSIYVKVTITNNTFEGLAAVPITLTVDGTNSVGDWDIENNTLSNPGPLCNVTAGADNMDVATQTINPRPKIDAIAPAPFAPGNQTN